MHFSSVAAATERSSKFLWTAGFCWTTCRCRFDSPLLRSLSSPLTDCWPLSDQWSPHKKTRSHQAQLDPQDRSQRRALFASRSSPKCALRRGAARRGCPASQEPRGALRFITPAEFKLRRVRGSHQVPRSQSSDSRTPVRRGKCVQAADRHIRPDRRDVTVSRAVTEEVNELHHADRQPEKQDAELQQETWRHDAPQRTNTGTTDSCCSSTG